MYRKQDERKEEEKQPAGGAERKTAGKSPVLNGVWLMKLMEVKSRLLWNRITGPE